MSKKSKRSSANPQFVDGKLVRSRKTEGHFAKGAFGSGSRYSKESKAKLGAINANYSKGPRSTRKAL